MSISKFLNFHTLLLVLSVAFIHLVILAKSTVPNASATLFSNSLPINVYKFPIQRNMANSNCSLSTSGCIKKYLDRLTGKKSIPERNYIESSTYRQTIYEYFDWLYMAECTIGNPPQQFTVLLDTQSSNLWVVDKSCKQSWNIRNDVPKNLSAIDSCGKAHRFDSSKSNTYKNDGRKFRTYDYNYAEGFLGNDILRFGGVNDISALSVPGIVFGQATDVAKGFVGSAPADGILGLAFRSIAFDDVEPPLMSAIRQGLLAKPMFTVFLDTLGDNAVHQAGGMFIYGGLDTYNCGPVLGWTSLTRETYYQFEIQGVSYGNKYRSKKRQQVISSTGDPFIYGDKKIIQNLAKHTGAHDLGEGYIYMIDCDAEYEPITFTISGHQYNLTKEMLTLKTLNHSNSKECYFAMFGHDHLFDLYGYDWVLGDPFIRQYCHIFDIGNKRMGFAPTIKKPKNAV